MLMIATWDCLDILRRNRYAIDQAAAVQNLAAKGQRDDRDALQGLPPAPSRALSRRTAGTALMRIARPKP